MDSQSIGAFVIAKLTVVPCNRGDFLKFRHRLQPEQLPLLMSPVHPASECWDLGEASSRGRLDCGKVGTSCGLW